MMSSQNAQSSNLNQKESVFDRHGGKLLALLSGGSGGSGIYFGEEAAKGSDNLNAALLLENLDKALTVNLFLSIAGVALAIVALLLPSLINASENITDLRNRKNIPGDENLSDFRRFVRAQKRLVACFLFCLIGVANSFVFDGVLEYQPEMFSEASMDAHVIAAAGPEWADLTEGISSTAILAISLAFLGLGGKSFLTAINKFGSAGA